MTLYSEEDDSSVLHTQRVVSYVESNAMFLSDMIKVNRSFQCPYSSTNLIAKLGRDTGGSYKS